MLIDGEPWLVAKDVCEVLGLADTNRALAGLDDDEKGTHIMSTLGGATVLPLTRRGQNHRFSFGA